MVPRLDDRLEDTLREAVGITDPSIVAVLAALSRFAQMYVQEQIHVRTPTSRPIGHEFGDGSCSTLVHEIPLDQTMSGQDVSDILSQSGLSGLTVSDASITTYWVRPNANPEDHIEYGVLLRWLYAHRSCAYPLCVEKEKTISETGSELGFVAGKAIESLSS